MDTLVRSNVVFEGNIESSKEWMFNDINIFNIQYVLSAWQQRNFVAEEAGELAHAVLKHVQKIRGYDDETKFKKAALDACADIMIYMCHVCTILRIDLVTAFELTAHKVMARDWVKDPQNGVCASSPESSSLSE